jgi:hypothetical protein
VNSSYKKTVILPKYNRTGSAITNGKKKESFNQIITLRPTTEMFKSRKIKNRAIQNSKNRSNIATAASGNRKAKLFMSNR